MRLILLSWALLGLIATPLVTAIVYQDLEQEAIIIDDFPDDSLELEAVEEATTESASGGAQICTNSNNVSGTCMKFDECFPYASLREEVEDIYLYQFANASAEPCPGSDNLICCPDYSYGLPIKKAQYEGQTTEIPSRIYEKSKRMECGANKYQDLKVVGGRKANPGEFPFAVAILNGQKQFCGGSLISDQWVLTAAHCIVNLRSFSNIFINAGDHDHGTSSEVQHQSRGVKRGLYNKGFSGRNLQHDVALLQLDRPVTLNERVQPVCLTSVPPPYNEKAVLAGWGKTGKNLPPSRTLKTVMMRVIPHEECKAEYAKEPQAPPVTSGMVCAGEKRPELKDACNGDSGGPLSIFDEGKATQIGVVSWGIGCGDKPGVYTRVDQYRSWIDKNSKRT